MAETVDNEIVSVSELKSRGWAKNDDGLWYDLESELSEQDGLEEDKKKEDYPIEEVKEFNKKLRR